MKYLTNIFIVVYVLSALSWTQPAPNMLQQRYNDVIRPVMAFTGLWQSWDMFSPEPLTINIHVEYKVVYSDGRAVLRSFPQLHKLDVVSRIFKERFRKFQENVRLDNNELLWQDLALWIARHDEKLARAPAASSRTITRVELIRRWGEMPAPGKALTAGPRNFIWGIRYSAAVSEARRDKSSVFFTYEVPGSAH